MFWNNLLVFKPQVPYCSYSNLFLVGERWKVLTARSVHYGMKPSSTPVSDLNVFSVQFHVWTLLLKKWNSNKYQENITISTWSCSDWYFISPLQVPHNRQRGFLITYCYLCWKRSYNHFKQHKCVHTWLRFLQPINTSLGLKRKKAIYWQFNCNS